MWLARHRRRGPPSSSLLHNPALESCIGTPPAPAPDFHRQRSSVHACRGRENPHYDLAAHERILRPRGHHFGAWQRPKHKNSSATHRANSRHGPGPCLTPTADSETLPTCCCLVDAPRSGGFATVYLVRGALPSRLQPILPSPPLPSPLAESFPISSARLSCDFFRQRPATFILMPHPPPPP